MPVLWSDPTEGQGILPAQAPFPGPAAVDPRLALAIGAQRQARQQQIANLVPQMFQALQQNMQQRQNDRIANSLLAAQATGQPVTLDALKAASNVGTFGFGGAPVQDYGGAQTYNAYNQALDANAKRQAANIHNAYLGSEIYKNVYGTPGHEGQMVDATLPTGETMTMSLKDATTLMGHYNRQAPQLTKAAQAEADKTLQTKTGYDYNTWKNIDFETPYSPNNPRTARLVNEKGETIEWTPENAADPKNMARVPIGTTTVQGQVTNRVADIPVSKYTAGAEIMKTFRGQETPGGITIRPHGGGTSGGAGATGPTGPPVGTKGTVNGVAAVWDGYGWKRAE